MEGVGSSGIHFSTQPTTSRKYSHGGLMVRWILKKIAVTSSFLLLPSQHHFSKVGMEWRRRR